jgi:hypothetical protein
MPEQKCPIWQTEADVHQMTDGWLRVYSTRSGGHYAIHPSAIPKMDTWRIDEKTLLTCWLVDQRLLGVWVPRIDEETLQLAPQRRRWSVEERTNYLLRCLKSENGILGSTFSFRQTINAERQGILIQKMYAWSASNLIRELVALVQFCQQSQWLHLTERDILSRTTATDQEYEFMLTAKGYARIAEIEGANSGSTEAFIAMWFDPSMNNAKTAIEEGIAEAGYKPVRIDDQEHNDKIDDAIIAAIRRSRFVVADFTQGESGARGGVYYEAGFAHGLNIPVIFTCHKEKLKTVHFDTRQYNHIAWDDAQDLRRRLAQRISATLGDGPFKKR